jgi:hypothetical protein
MESFGIGIVNKLKKNDEQENIYLKNNLTESSDFQSKSAII